MTDTYLPASSDNPNSFLYCDYTATNFNAMTVGEVYALVESLDAPLINLMKAATIGRQLLLAAVSTAYERDEYEHDGFFDRAGELLGPKIIDSVVEEMNLPPIGLSREERQQWYVAQQARQAAANAAAIAKAQEQYGGQWPTVTENE